MTCATAQPITPNPIELRAARLFDDDLNRTRVYTDRLMARLLMIQWVGAVAAALIISPRTWIGATSHVHLHVWASIVIGSLLSIFPVILSKLFPGSALTRHCIAAAQVLFSTLLIHVTGGRIETHFHIFGSLAFLAFYRDWKVLLTATTIVAIDHFVRGVWYPQSVFGVLASSQWRWLEHAGWVIFEDIVLLLSIQRGTQDTRALAEGRAMLEATNHAVEEQVMERTHQLELAISAAEAANQAKSDFLANMSHEIRTPMTAIVGYADLLDEPTLTAEERAEHISTIRSNGEHLVTLVNDLLDISKIEAGRMSLNHEPCNICQLVHDIAAFMRVRADARNIPLDVELRYPLPETIVGDPLRIRQILVNLVGNAIKFTPAGRIRIVVYADHLDKPHPYIHIDVIDTGIGIPEKALTTLFMPFTQVDSSGSRRFGGTGLGLALSRRLAEMLGGDITVDSTLDKGSTFTLDLPVGLVDNLRLIHAPSTPPTSPSVQPEPLNLPPSSPPAPKPAAHSSPSISPTLHGKILIAEDGPDNQRLISHHLRKAGADVTVVENGQLALEQALNAAQLGTPFGLIFMDMQMPVCDGYAATSKLRAAGYTLPIVALTAHAMTGDREKCLAAGCDEYLTKPINAPLLIQTASRFLRIASQQKHPQTAACEH